MVAGLHGYIGFMGVRLKNEWQSPIGGWQHTDAPISSEPITVWSVNELVQNVIARRRQNPRFGLSLDAAAVKQEVLRQNADRMQKIRGGEHYLVQDDSIPGPAPGQQSFSPPQHGRRSAAARVRNVAAGVGILLDWLGGGGEAVDLPVADARAKVCADCPLNQPKDFLAFFTDPVAEKIRKQISIKNEMELATQYDERLHVCTGCGCSLKLKVWCPGEHIAKHTSAEVKGKLDARCWVLPLLK
jgi:hypothetical protein